MDCAQRPSLEPISVRSRDDLGICTHHWIIETPDGETSKGRCRRCNTVRDFPNAAEDALLERDQRPVGRWRSHRHRRPDDVPDQAA